MQKLLQNNNNLALFVMYLLHLNLLILAHVECDLSTGGLSPHRAVSFFVRRSCPAPTVLVLRPSRAMRTVLCGFTEGATVELPQDNCTGRTTVSAGVGLF